MIRFSHTLFALPFALLAAVMAWVQRSGAPAPVPFRWTELAGIVLAMIFARSASMAFNRIVDRRIDAQNPRTAMRHLPSGQISLSLVGWFCVACSLGFVVSTLLFWSENRWPLYLSVPVLAFLLSYSFTKRFTALAHFWLGAALMLDPLCAWIAIRGSLAWPPVVLGGAVLLWVAGFDIIYACQDFGFDTRVGLYSMPASLGVSGALRLAAVCHLGMLALLAVLPWTFPLLGSVYWIGIGAVAVLLGYEHWIVRPDDLNRVNTAFFHVNTVISFGLFLVGTLDLLT